MFHFAKEIIIFDTEFTAWEGSHAAGWSKPGEYREIIEIGAIRVRTDTLTETASQTLYVQPVKNPILSDYIIELTGVTQQTIDSEGTSLTDAMSAFLRFIGDAPCYSYGPDIEVVRANCELIGVAFPFTLLQFHDVRDIFRTAGIDTSKYMSSTIVRAFGTEPTHRGHDGLNDARSILQALQEMKKRDA